MDSYFDASQGIAFQGMFNIQVKVESSLRSDINKDKVWISTSAPYPIKIQSYEGLKNETVTFNNWKNIRA
jgi:hypothetical protein